MKLNNDDLVWNIKKNILNTIAPDLKDSLNYGFYQPSTAFKAAKYLDEDRSLREYNLEEGTTLQQLIVKKKIYKASTLNTKKLKELNVKSNKKKFIQYIQDGTVVKVARLIDKGLDPNFIDTETGECPLTLSAQLTNPQQIMTSLVEGGAHLDFRNRDGWTAMHRAAHLNNLPALQALLNFGASANYQDENGLTPLYNSILTNSNPSCAGALLRDFALLGIVDGQGNTELHQACKLGRVQHLDLLISYGADLNCQNNTGNTPLHLCAMHNQVS
uniref:Ubiquitin-like domain-containing protein n=1 Tax=Helobdella robusta TaxID=6412 RepID=T1FZE1_HELRO